MYLRGDWFDHFTCKKENWYLNTSNVKSVVKNGPSLKSDRMGTDLDGHNESLHHCLEAAIEIILGAVWILGKMQSSASRLYRKLH